jgi:hypothetical protein
MIEKPWTGTNKDKYNSTVKKSWSAALVFGLAFALYFFTRGIGLDDWDSVQFAMGMREFNLWRHQPHPPGYPLLILLARGFDGVLHLGPEFALHLISSLGGALFVTVWFLIVRTYFNELSGWLLAATLAITPIVWMTATRPISDAAAAGLMGAQLLHALRYRESGRRTSLIFTALLGAAASGIRPQIIFVAGIIMALTLCRRPARIKRWAFALFAVACLLWLAPMWYLQWKLRPELPWWEVYPKLVADQWSWRLDKPTAFIGAGDWSYSYLAERFNAHILGWFTTGLGILQWRWSLALGTMFIATGITLYLRRLQQVDLRFWKFNASWATAHVASIFCFAPWEQRYYLPIFPLLLLAILLGYLRLPTWWKLLALSIPALLLVISLPLAIQNHVEPAPAIRFVRFLHDRHPAAERNQVLLLLQETQRAAEWYAIDFQLYSSFDASADRGLLEGARAVYTDDPMLELPPGWHLTFVTSFSRSELISPKQSAIDLYQIERD